MLFDFNALLNKKKYFFHFSIETKTRLKRKKKPFRMHNTFKVNSKILLFKLKFLILNLLNQYNMKPMDAVPVRKIIRITFLFKK